jgi:hypothetical protein
MMDANVDGRVSRKELRHGLLNINVLPHVENDEKRAEKLTEFVERHLETVSLAASSAVVESV